MTTKTLNSSNESGLLAAVEGIARATADMAQHSATLAKLCADLLSGARRDIARDIALAQPKPMPTREQCQDPSNKIGVNLSPRGIELIYRLFDHGSSVRAASLAFGISHRAAKWRKGAWEKAGGKDRPTSNLDID
jgi:hypothetical protein